MTTTAASPLKIIVVGAGIGGLAAAVALRAIGARVEVHEQARALTRVGAGLQLAPNATATLRGLGLLDRLSPRTCRPTAWCSYDATSGAIDHEVARRRHRAGIRIAHVHRGDLHDVLIGAVGDVHLDHRVVGVD